ncbi:MAG: DNA polymerase III subunit delta' [Candidatus Omnitrophota bacterium]
MSSGGIKGQDSAISFLRRSLGKERTAHAYIFSGPRGVGKMSTALYFAKAMNCGAAHTDRPCGKCDSCTAMEKGAHPDLFIFAPQKPGSSVKIDAVRELIKDISLRPYKARKKVCIIDEAGSMTREASNALLKTLEEPPPDSVLILIAEDTAVLLPTIVSRAQVVRFFALRAGDVEVILAQDRTLSPGQARVLARFSGGSPGKALEYMEKDFFRKRDMIAGASSGRRLLELDFDNTPREDLGLYLDIMLSWYRDIIAAKSDAGGFVALIHEDKHDVIKAEAGTLDADYLEGVTHDIISTTFFLGQSANAKLAMNTLLLRMAG